MAYIHFTAEGEVTFKSILFVPTSAPRGLFDEYGSKKNDFIKVWCSLVFIIYCKGALHLLTFLKSPNKVSKSVVLFQLFVRRVFITDDFNDMMPKYLNFVKGVVSLIVNTPQK